MATTGVDEAEAALIAAIEVNPDDVEAYYVYGDYLQGKGDPRGELVALQAAELRSPDDKKVAARADKYLREHADALVGAIDGHGKAATYVWRCGFIRDATLELFGDAMLRLVRDLVRHPAGRFLQSLVIGGGNRTANIDKLVDLLVAEGPRTLANLRMGDGALPDDALETLRATFPRLDAAHDVAWRAILAAVAEQRRVDLKYDAGKLPELVPIAVMPPELDTKKLLVALRLELDKKKPLGVTAAMKRTFTADSLDRFAVALGDQFSTLGETTSIRWGFLAMGGLGGEATARWIGTRLSGWSHQRAEQGMDLLRQIGTPAALWEVYVLGSDPRNRDARRDVAMRVIDAAAGERGLGREPFVDRIVPAQVSVRGREAITRRLREALIDGRRFDARDFMRYVVTHPVVGPYAEKVVWASYERSEVELTFRSTGERLVDLDGSDVDLEGAVIGAVHPAELGDPNEAKRLAEAWKDAFEALEIEPLFPQLDKPVHALRDSEKGPMLTRWKLRSVGFDHLRDVLEGERGWTPLLIDSEWGTDGWERVFHRDGVAAVARIDHGAIGTVTLSRNGKAIAVEKLDPVTRSELIDDLEVATTRPGAPAPTANAPKQTVATGGLEKGTRVCIKSGPDRGVKGVVFWIGAGNDGGTRVGIRAEDGGETHWADLTAIITLPPKGAAASGGNDDDEDEDDEREPVLAARRTPAAADDDDDDAKKPGGEDGLAFAKGSHVDWHKGKHSGQGVVFWIGKNKFGDGMRVGVRDDETQETVWADAADCSPVADE